MYFENTKTLRLNVLNAKYYFVFQILPLLRNETMCRDGQYLKYMHLKYVFEIQNCIYFVFKYH